MRPLLVVYGLGAIAVGGVALALVLHAKGAPSLASRVRPGMMLRAHVRSPSLTAEEVCMRAVSVSSTGIVGRVQDARFPGIAIDVLVRPDDVVSVAAAESRACAPLSHVTWVEIDGSPVMLRRGIRYRGCVRTGIVPRSLVRGKLRPALEERGFDDLVIAEAAPEGWDGVECDFYVEGTWSRPDESFDRPGAVALAWKAA